MTKPCITPRCRRARREPEGDVQFAHCLTCQARLTREAFGPVSWHDRARSHELPALVVGGLPIETNRHTDSPLSRRVEGLPRATSSPSQQVAELTTTG